ncbi:MAG: hypothetical protein GXX79_16460 [Actinomycetales bacterium]|nr:hypothetical protein [Actinomycetales bacterium]
MDTPTTISVIALLVAVVALVTARRTGPGPTTSPLDAERLAVLERQQRVILERLRAVAPAAGAIGLVGSAAGAEPDLPEVLDLLVRGQKIQAVKAYREATGLGLKESKDAVEELARRHGLSSR